MNRVKEQALKELWDKVRSGEYPTREVTVCACGGKELEEIAAVERDGLPVKALLCRRCGLIATSPKLTQEAMAAFYNNEYYRIYYSGDGVFLGNSLELANFAPYQGEMVFNFCKDQLPPTTLTIIEVGCGIGLNLYQFGRQAGKAGRGGRVLGVEYAAACRRYAAECFDIKEVYPQISDLLVRNERAQVVILSHILEHVADLDVFLNNISQLLDDGGLLYIEVPGILDLENKQEYCYNLVDYLCFAHTFSFNLETLKFHLARHGFDCITGTEYVRALFRKSRTASCRQPPGATTSLIGTLLAELAGAPFTSLSQSLRYEKLGDYSRARQYANAALKSRPVFPQAQYSLARQYFQGGDYDQALSCMQQALDAGMAVTAPLLLLQGNIFEKSGRYPEALQTYRQSWELEPADRRPVVAQARCLRLMGRLPEALEVISTIDDRRVFEFQAAFEEGMILLELGRRTEALEIFRMILRRQPAALEVRLCEGVTLRQLDRLPEALSSLRAALALAPEDVRILCHLASTQRDLGQMDKALATLEDVLRIEPLNWSAKLLQGGCLARAGRYEEAVAVFAAILAANPQRWEILLNISDAHRYAGEYDQALEAVDRLERLSPDAPGIWLTRGKIFSAAGQRSAAQACYRQEYVRHGTELPADWRGQRGQR